jgi:hypothetical protein
MEGKRVDKGKEEGSRPGAPKILAGTPPPSSHFYPLR